MNRKFYTAGFQTPHITGKQLEAALTQFANDQKKQNVSGGKLTSIVVKTINVDYVLQVRYSCDGATEQIVIHKMEELNEKSRVQYADAKTVDARPIIEADMRPKDETPVLSASAVAAPAAKAVPVVPKAAPKKAAPKGNSKGKK